MIVPELMPGEILWGYWERFCAINHFDRDRAGRALRHGIAPSNGNYKWPNLVTLLAGKHGMTTMDLCQHFTTLPFDRAVTDTYSWLRHGDPEMETIIRHKVRIFARLGGMICPDCVIDDESRWGFAYFRREHQLPGINHCSVHQSHLLWQARTSENFFPSNTAILKAVNNASGDDCPNDKLLRENYLGITKHWLKQTSPIPVQVFKDVVKGRKPQLDDEIYPWLDSLFFMLTNRVEYVHSPHAATLLAAMFESAEDALNSIETYMNIAIASGATLAPERFHESLASA